MVVVVCEHRDEAAEQAATILGVREVEVLSNGQWLRFEVGGDDGEA